MASGQKNREEDRFLELAVQGDSEGLEYLVNAYKDLAYTIAIKIVLNREDAEEVVQDAFMKAFASLHRFKNSSKFSTWLYRIIYNTALTKIKGRKLTAPYSENRIDNGKYSNIGNEGWDALLLDDKRKYINLVLNGLTPEDRSIFALHYIGEKTIMEISKILDLKRSAIKMRLSRGRQRLMKELQLLLGDETKDLL